MLNGCEYDDASGKDHITRRGLTLAVRTRGTPTFKRVTRLNSSQLGGSTTSSPLAQRSLAQKCCTPPYPLSPFIAASSLEMGKKKRTQVFVLKPWCWYCEREFEDEKGGQP